MAGRCLCVLLLSSSLVWAGPGDEPILVRNPATLRVDRLPAERLPLGDEDDYKPCIVLLPNGELIVVAFHQHKLPAGRIRENILLFRSRDGGRTWSRGQTLDIVGREPYLTVLRDGTLFMTVHLLAQDIRNKDGFTHSYLHRSTDGGRTWTTIRIGPEGFPPKAETMTSRTVLELPDGALLLGVDAARGPAFVWRSTDRGKTWLRTQSCNTGGFKSAYSYFGESFLWRTRSGKIINIVRVDSDEHPISGLPVPGGKGDQRDHLVLYESTDQCRSMRKVADFGSYGEMYPSVLRLKDGRMLLTFTVRDLTPPLGVQAVPGTEKEDSFSFDFGRDRLVLDAKTPKNQPSGGGFGPTVQLADGTLVTAYSFRTSHGKTRLEILRWKLPPGR
jgi:hypothetical protein